MKVAFHLYIFWDLRVGRKCFLQTRGKLLTDKQREEYADYHKRHTDAHHTACHISRAAAHHGGKIGNNVKENHCSGYEVHRQNANIEHLGTQYAEHIHFENIKQFAHLP
jgi:hypothetical protein